jgi:nucleoside-diphosphate-sugar epimerase
LAGVDSVVHLAAIVGDPACGVDEDEAWAVNYLGTIRVAEASQRAGVKSLVFASTCSNYGAASEEEVDIWSPLAPQSVYAESKIMAEHYLLSLPHEGMSRTLLRFATVHGLSPRMRFDLAINIMTAHAVTRGVVNVHGGDQWRPFLHIEDVGQAVRRALAVGYRPGSHVYNCGSGQENYRMADIGQLIASEVEGVRVETHQDQTDPRNYKVNFDLVGSELGFAPEHSVRDSVRAIRDAMRRGEYADFTGAVYSNVLTARAQQAQAITAS